MSNKKKVYNMALIKCTECGAEISDKATACPNCGCPVQYDDQVEETQNRPKRIGKWILVAVIAVLAIGSSIAYFTMNKDNIIKKILHEEPMVKLTPEFCKAVRKYNCLWDFENGFAGVQNGEKWGFINTEGKEIVPCVYDMVSSFNDGLAAVCKNDKWGYVNTEGELVIPCIYEYANEFSEGLASVRKNGKDGFINKKGEVAIPLKYEECGIFCEGLAYAGDKKGHYFIDTGGNIKIHLPKGFYIERGSSSEGHPYPEFHDGICNILVGDDYDYYINTKGEKVAPPKSQASAAETISEYKVYRNDDGLVGVKNAKTNKIIIPAKYESIGESSSSRGVDDIVLHNGVVVATLAYKTLQVNGAYLDRTENVEWDTNTEYIYGYIDMNGNETFTSEDYKLIKEKNNDFKQEECKWQQEKEKRAKLRDDLLGAWYSQQSNTRLYMFFDNDKITVYISDRYTMEYTYNLVDGIIYMGEKGKMYYDEENGLRGSDGKVFYKDESISSLEEMKEAARSYYQGYSSSSSNSYGSSNSNPYERDMRRLTEHTSEYRSGSWRGDPARLMYLQQAIISDYDNLISTARSQGDERRYYGFLRAKEAQMAQFRSR